MEKESEITNIKPSSNKSKVKLFQSVLAEGKFIGLVSLLGYLAAYMYQLGYFSRFNIPSDFIIVDLLSVIVSIFGIAGVLFLWVVIIDPLYKELFRPTNELQIRIRNFIIILIYLLVVRFILYRGFFDVTFVITVVAVVAFMYFVIPFLFYSKHKNFLKKVEAHEQDWIKDNKNSVISNFFTSVGHFGKSIFIIFIIILAISLDVGRGTAFKKEKYSVVYTGTSKLVVLQVYDTRILAKKFDEKSKTLVDDLTILSIQTLSDKGFSIKHEKLGKLN